MSVLIPQSDATLALDALVNALTADTAVRLDPPPNVLFGWREPPKQVTQGTGGANRVVIVPGDASGKVGDLSGAKDPGRDPTPIATMAELATIYMWAVDATDLTDARLQWRAARRLHDVVIASLIRNFRGRWKQLSKTWVRSELERPFGAEIELVFAIEAMIPGDLIPQATGGTVTPVWTANGAAC